VATVANDTVYNHAIGVNWGELIGGVSYLIQRQKLLTRHTTLNHLKILSISLERFICSMALSV
jgi:hypothetical protein